MQIKLLKDIVANIAGKESEKIVDLLHGKNNVNEFLIAKKMNLTINQTRNILYKLADVGLVSFIRKKDSKKGGWYTYFWTLNTHKSLELLRDQIQKELNKVESEIGRRTRDRFYYSPNADIEYTEEQALENDFICPETGDVMVLRDNSQIIEATEKEKASLRKLFDEVNVEVVAVEEKAEKSKQRRLKAEAKKKEAERKEKRAIAAKKRKQTLKEKAKNSKKTKKPAKKTVKKSSKKRKKKI